MSNKNVKQQSILVYIPNHLYPTPSASGKKLVILLVPRRITDGKHLLLYIVPQKLKKVNQTFFISIAILCTCIILRNCQFYATAISLRILSAKSHKIILSAWYHPVRLVSFCTQNPDETARKNTRYTSFSGPGTLGDKIFRCIVWKKFLKLTVELCRQSLVVCDDQCRFI